MSEIVVNLFLFVESDIIIDLGAVAHVHDNADAIRIVAFLESQVERDVQVAAHYPLPVKELKTWLGVDASNGLPCEMFSYLGRMGHALRFFDSVLAVVNAPPNPCVCVTPVIGGKPFFESRTHVEPPTNPSSISQEFSGIVKRTDYLAAYLTPKGFDIHSLLHADFTQAIILLHSRKKYVSMMKLFVSFIDTLAFLEFGNVRDGFSKWLSTYAQIASVGVAEAEIWELRNALLHMTNPISRKVATGKVIQLGMYSDPTSKVVCIDPKSGTKLFSIEAFYEAVMGGLEPWAKSYSGNLPKQLEFIRRYDTILSEGRIAPYIPPSDTDKGSPSKK